VEKGGKIPNSKSAMERTGKTY